MSVERNLNLKGIEAYPSRYIENPEQKIFITPHPIQIEPPELLYKHAKILNLHSTSDPESPPTVVKYREAHNNRAVISAATAAAVIVFNFNGLQADMPKYSADTGIKGQNGQTIKLQENKLVPLINPGALFSRQGTILQTQSEFSYSGIAPQAAERPFYICPDNSEGWTEEALNERGIYDVDPHDPKNQIVVPCDVYGISSALNNLKTWADQGTIKPEWTIRVVSGNAYMNPNGNILPEGYRAESYGPLPVGLNNINLTGRAGDFWMLDRSTIYSIPQFFAYKRNGTPISIGTFWSYNGTNGLFPEYYRTNGTSLTGGVIEGQRPNINSIVARWFGLDAQIGTGNKTTGIFVKNVFVNRGVYLNIGEGNSFTHSVVTGDTVVEKRDDGSIITRRLTEGVQGLAINAGIQLSPINEIFASGITVKDGTARFGTLVFTEGELRHGRFINLKLLGGGAAYGPLFRNDGQIGQFDFINPYLSLDSGGQDGENVLGIGTIYSVGGIASIDSLKVFHMTHEIMDLPGHPFGNPAKNTIYANGIGSIELLGFLGKNINSIVRLAPIPEGNQSFAFPESIILDYSMLEEVPLYDINPNDPPPWPQIQVSSIGLERSPDITLTDGKIITRNQAFRGELLTVLAGRSGNDIVYTRLDANGQERMVDPPSGRVTNGAYNPNIPNGETPTPPPATVTTTSTATPPATETVTRTPTRIVTVTVTKTPTSIITPTPVQTYTLNFPIVLQHR